MFGFNFEGLGFDEANFKGGEDNNINSDLLKEARSMSKEEDLDILDLPISKLINLEEQ